MACTLTLTRLGPSLVSNSVSAAISLSSSLSMRSASGRGCPGGNGARRSLARAAGDRSEGGQNHHGDHGDGPGSREAGKIFIQQQGVVQKDAHFPNGFAAFLKRVID